MDSYITNLPQSLSKTITDLARTREKAAKQKYLLDLGESLVMHLSAFLIAEYKNTGLIHLELEKAFIKNNRNLSFGIYLGFIREAVKFLNMSKNPSKIHALLDGKNTMVEIGKFIKAYEAIKDSINNEKTGSLVEAAEIKSKENPGNLNLMNFFNSFIELRNRVAHPHKEVKGKNISWPFNEDYFDSINPYIEKALFSAIDFLSNVWEFKVFTVQDSLEKKLFLQSETGEVANVDFDSDLASGVKVILNQENDLLLFDWKILLKAGEEGLNAIKKEEDELRNKASVDDLKLAIIAALEDGQISRDEFNFFESIGKTKMNLSKNELKAIILEVASNLGIDDPFPEVDQRYVDLIDDAIKNKTYNEFLLKLTGQQYGVDTDMFNKIFEDRAFALNVDPIEVKTNRVFQFSTQDLFDFQGLMRTQQWMLNIGMFNKLSKESFYKITGDHTVIGSKEYAHRNAFKSLEHFVKSRIKKLCPDSYEDWGTRSNNWQIGAMTSYAWTSIFPQNSPSGRVLALNLTIYSDGYIHTGFLPDWKDYDKLENYGLLLYVFKNHLKDFALTYRDELIKYPHLKVWDTPNNKGVYSFLEAFDQIPWYFDYLYEFDMIQFGLTTQDVEKKPISILESFDIIFNLFSGLFEYVNRDYLNLLDAKFLIDEKQDQIRNKLSSLNPIFSKYKLLAQNTIDEKESEEQTTTEDRKIIGEVKKGFLGIEFKKTLKGFPIIFDVRIKQNYHTNALYLQIHVSTAGYEEKQYHALVEKVLLEMAEIQFENASVYYMKSKLIVCQDILDIELYQPTLIDDFLAVFSELCAANSIQVLGIEPASELMNQIEGVINSEMDQLEVKLNNLLKGKINKERSRMKGNRFVDFVSSSKNHGLHSLAWGLGFNRDSLFTSITMSINDSIIGFKLVDEIKNFLLTNTDWKFSTSSNKKEESATWIFSSLKENQLSASSQWNRNYTPKHAVIDSPVNYWCSRETKEEQPWIQFDFESVKLIDQLKIQGAPREKNYITKFDIHYSLDGKNWQIITGVNGNDGLSETNHIFLKEPIISRHLKIVPTEWVNFAGLRIDFFAQDVLPEKVIFNWKKPIENVDSVSDCFQKMEEELVKFKQNLEPILVF